MSPPTGDDGAPGCAGGGSLGERAEEVFFEALERPSEERSELVARRCRGDAALELEVRSLLEAHEQTGPLDRLQDELVRWGEALVDDGSHPERLGRYEVLGRLGSGGMAVVLRAFDPRLEREVAVKVIGRRLGARPEMLERFEREARAASALSHPNIITVHDFGEQDGHPFLVMELVEGESLRRVLGGSSGSGLAGARLPVDEILRLGTQLADGLATAHEAGVVHRDLKPENVLVDRRGTARILDFGLAFFRGPAPDGSPGEDPGTGPVAGTAGYTAPEVVRGEEVDHRSDQFALGAILYEMAAGRSPFPTEDVVNGLAATLDHEPAPASELRGDLPPELAEIIHRCLAKRPDERYPETAELLAALRAVTVTPPAPRPSARRGSLPVPATPLYGRRDEIRRLRALLPEAGVRLVTLTGPGGSGKTRLAIEAARRLEPEYPGGALFVDLAGTQDPELVIPAIAAAVGGVEAGGEETASLIEALNATAAETGGPILLVLDNVEHVIEAVPRVAELLEACPDLTVLATSRERLNLRAEHDLPVAPLALPSAASAASAAGPDALDAVAAAPAVALFVGRARAARAGFRLTEDNAAAVVELCRRLEGLPLALELAAARVRTLPPRAMLRRLANRMELLTGGPRDLPARQRTLRAALDWSHDLLDATEQKALRRLSVFSGGFTLEAAEAVVDPFGGLERDVVDLVESLHGQSLLGRLGEQEDDPRFTMLETIREYAAERLDASGEAAPTRKAHAAYFLVLAEEAASAFDRGRGPEWLERLRTEEANFRAALDRLIADDAAEWGLRTAQGLFHFWELGESFSEGRRRFEQLLALPSAGELTELRAKGLFSAGVLAAGQRDRARGIEYHRRCLELYRWLGDRHGQAVALNGLGIQLTDQGRYDEARACYDEALELWEELGESHGAAASLSNFAFVLRNQGELEHSRRLYRDAAAMFERLGDPVGAAWETSHEADVVRDQAPRNGDGAWPEAVRLYRRALERFRELHEPWGIGSTLADLGRLAQDAGRLDEADASYREALAQFARVGHQRGVARVLEALATLAGDRDDDARVLWLAGAAERLRERLGRPPGDRDVEAALDAAVARARERLDRRAAEAAWDRGRSRSLDGLVEAICSGGAGGSQA